jgi:hypothetical protein
MPVERVGLPMEGREPVALAVARRCLVARVAASVLSIVGWPLALVVLSA